MTLPPRSRSLFRGQARDGIGEGGDGPAIPGEQYLGADPELRRGDLLTTLRPWLTLDSDPADRQRLGERLEAWSCFEERGWLVVARLTAAGVFDRRQAYFSHARAWPADELRGGFDPGALIGRADAFEKPWREAGERRPLTGGEPVPGWLELPAVAAEPEVAARYLAALLQARLDANPLCIAAPISDFASGSHLASLVSFARAALPEDLKRGCRLRIYTRLPRLYLDSRQADLLALPEAVAAEALAARRDGTLVDRLGVLHEGREPSSETRRYADAVVECALSRPSALLDFSHRFADFRQATDGTPETSDLLWAATVYDLVASGGDDVGTRLGRALRRMTGLRQGAPPPPWRRLLSAADWERLKVEDLLHLVFEDGMPTELRQMAEQALANRNRMADSHLDGWWEAKRLPRLVDLFARDQPLVSASAVADRSRGLPLAGLEPDRCAAVLAAEDEAGVLDQRSDRELGQFAAQPACRRTLLAAVRHRRLAGGWLRELAPAALPAVVHELVAGRLDGEHVTVAMLLEQLLVAPSLERVPIGELGQLVAALPGARRDLAQGAYTEVTRRFELDAATTTGELIRAGWWFYWQGQACLEAAAAHRAAVEWLCSEAWAKVDEVPTMETWHSAIGMLGDGLSSEEMERLCLVDRRPTRRWPQIAGFEGEQLDDLALHGHSLTTLALLGLACFEELGRLCRIAPDLGVDGELLAALVSTAYNSDGPEPPVIPLDRISLLTGVRGALRPSARRLSVRLLLMQLDRDPEGVLAVWTKQELWRDPLATANLRGWVPGAIERGRLQALQAVDRRLASLGNLGLGTDVEPPTREQREAGRRLRDDLPTLARFMGAVHQQVADSGLPPLLAAVARGDAVQVGQELQTLLGRDPEGVPVEVYWLIKELRGQTIDTFPGGLSLPRFLQAVPPTCLGERSGRLPCFALAAEIFQALSLGELTRCFAFQVERKREEMKDWWRALLLELKDNDRQHGAGVNDRPEVARALLYRAHEELEPDDGLALLEALRETHPTPSSPSDTQGDRP